MLVDRGALCYRALGASLLWTRPTIARQWRDLLLALPHFRWPRVAVLAGSRCGHMSDTKICALVAPFQVPDSARGLQRRLQVMCRCSPNLAASSAYGRASTTWWRQNFELRKKTRISASSHIVLAAFLHGHRTPADQACAEPKSIIMLLPKLTCPSRLTWLLGRLPIGASCHIQVPLPTPASPPLGRRPTT